jgi:hypothetical protein
MTTTSTGDGAWTSVVGAVDISDDVVIAHDVTLDGNVDMTGELKINSGKSLNTTGSNHALTVDGDLIVLGTVTGNASAISVGSLRVDGTYSATSGTTIITSERSNGRAIDIVGTYTHNSGTLEIRTPADTDLRYPSSSSLNDLTINHASCIARPTGDNKPVIGGDLTITAGTFNTLDSGGGSSHALTVTGTTTIGPNSGAADQATLTCNASAVSLGSGITSAYALLVQRGGTFDGGSGTHTLGSVRCDTDDNTKAKIDFTSGVTTINSENSSSNRTFELDEGNITHSDGTITITLDGSSEAQWTTTTGDNGPYNLIINHASCVQRIRSNLSVLNNLTITAGTFNTHSNDGGADKNLTVAGALTNNGTLTLNSSTVNLGSTSAQAGDFQGSGTFNFDTSTINFHTGGTANFAPDQSATVDSNTSTLNLIGLDSSTRAHNFDFNSGNMHNVTTSRGAGSGTHIDKLSANCTITGDLTVGANSKFSSGTRVFTVNGDVSVTGELDCDDSDKPMTFGSLTINSGGTYTATSGTTTITAEKASHAWKNEGGTFTHNNGKVKIYDATGTVMGSTSVRETTFYDLEISLFANTMTCSFFDADGSNAVTILNNLDITKGEMEFSTASDTITIHGLTNISSNAEFNDNVGHDTNKIIHNGLITNKGTYNISDGTTVKMNGGIRNLGTITVK